ncbi:hypothetical protein HU200_028833 [Digitaria exilis]|uniref:DUF4220 domain-containing protein n=1 Tax=Digitaria exilis TaxID=1010633 RepID=A0A835C3Z2_9POAL|nr:hypothetical protein HU200_028833 [Digitaria exilis]
MQSSSIKNELFVVWACFLLLLLGIGLTAFSFNDSNQQTRSMMNQGLHIIYLLLLIIYYKGQLRHTFLIALFLLWTLSVVRLGLRVRAYRSTCRSRGLVRDNQIVKEYMEYEPLHSGGFVGGTSATYDPKTMDGYIYLIDGKEVKKVVRGKEVIQVAYRQPQKFSGGRVEQVPVPPETVDVGRVWQCKGNLLASGDRGASRHKDLCLSFALFNMLRLRFGADHAGDIQFKFQGDKCRDFVVNGLLSDDQDLDRAFRVVETELGFLFDFFYARYPSIKDTLAPDMVVYAAILATSIFTLLGPGLLKYKPTQGTQSIFIHGFNVDLLIIRLVILWYIVIESYQFIACLIFSDWHKVKMLCRYVRNESWHNRLLVEIPLKVLCHFTFSKHWKGSMGQYFLLDDTHPHWFKSFLSWISLKSLDTSLMTSSTKVDSDVKHAVLLQLKNCNGKVTDGMMMLYEMGLIDPSLDRTCWIGHKYADYIQEWHVATSICSYALNLDKNKSRSAELMKNHGIATKLSGYCMYLMVFQPELVPASTYESLSLSRGTLQNARDFLADCKSNKEKYEKLMNLGRSSQANFEFLTVYKGAQIAVHLTEKSRVRDDEELRWKALANFWANMILYIAPSDRAVAHAAKMATGGEFITIVWAMLSHAHIVDKFLPNNQSAPGLHTLIEKQFLEENSKVPFDRSMVADADRVVSSSIKVPGRVKKKKGEKNKDFGHASIEGGSLENC